MTNNVNHKASYFIGILAVLASYLRRFQRDNIKELFERNSFSIILYLILYKV